MGIFWLASALSFLKPSLSTEAAGYRVELVGRNLCHAGMTRHGPAEVISFSLQKVSESYLLLFQMFQLVSEGLSEFQKVVSESFTDFQKDTAP
jgi:hypothetical protein